MKTAGIERIPEMTEDKRDPQTYAIIGAAMEVHGHLGGGFLEPVYREAMTLELTDRGIPFRKEVPLFVRYKSHQMKCSYRADFICFEQILIELKALSHLGGPEGAQTINYLKATGLTRGLLLNFGGGRLEFERFILSSNSISSASSVPSASSADSPSRSEVINLDVDDTTN